LIQREGHLIVIDDGTSSTAVTSTEGSEARRSSSENRILAVAPNYVID